MKGIRGLRGLAVVIMLALIICSSVLLAQGYNTRIYMRQGGAEQVVGSGGKTTYLSGGILDFESGSYFKIAGTQVTTSAAEFNRLAGITPGTSLASKAIVVDASRFISYLGITDARLTDVTVSDSMTVAGIVTSTNATDASAVGTASVTLAGGLGVTKKIYVGTELNMATGTTGTQSIVLKDSVADALSIIRGSTDMVVFNTSTPAITITPATDVVGDFTAGTVTSDAGVGGTIITASTGFALGDGDYAGIIDNERLIFNAAGTIVVAGADFHVGNTVADNVVPALKIVADADSDGTATTSETLQIVLTPNATPTSATWGFTSTQGAGYTFDKAVTFTGGIANTGTVTTVDIDGGAIDGVTIGANAAPTVTNLGSVATCDINGGTIDATTIGASTAAAVTATAIKGTSIAIGTSGAEVEITATPARINNLVYHPGVQATAAIDFNAVGTATMTITIDGATYSETDIAVPETGHWTNGSTAADSATSLIAAINGDTRATVPFTAYADASGDGVILVWDAVGTAGNVTITSSDGSATTANSVGGENAGLKQVVNITRTITTNDLLAGAITIPVPFAPTGFNVNAVNASGTPVYFTDTVTIAATPNRILITTGGGTNLANTDIVHLTVWE